MDCSTLLILEFYPLHRGIKLRRLHRASVQEKTTMNKQVLVDLSLNLRLMVTQCNTIWINTVCVCMCVRLAAIQNSHEDSCTQGTY